MSDSVPNAAIPPALAKVAGPLVYSAAVSLMAGVYVILKWQTAGGMMMLYGGAIMGTALISCIIPKGFWRFCRTTLPPHYMAVMVVGDCIAGGSGLLARLSGLLSLGTALFVTGLTIVTLGVVLIGLVPESNRPSPGK